MVASFTTYKYMNDDEVLIVNLIEMGWLQFHMEFVFENIKTFSHEGNLKKNCVSSMSAVIPMPTEVHIAITAMCESFTRST